MKRSWQYKNRLFLLRMMPGAGICKRDLLSVVAGVLLGASALLLAHRGVGIYQDSMLYMGLGLHWLQPDLYSRDLFFAFGSQGDYTIFPWLIGNLLKWFRPSELFFWGGLLGMLMFAAASWFFIGAMLNGSSRFYAWLGVLSLPAQYVEVSLFSNFEGHLTPRVLSDSFCLMAMVFLGRKHYFAALACLAVAFVLHPLQAIGATLIIWPWLVMSDRRWLHLAWLGVPVVIAALYGLPPLDGLVRVLDPVWLNEIQSWTRQLFVADWDLKNYETLAFDAGLLAWAAHVLSGQIRRWCLAALMGLCFGLVTSLVLVDGLHLELPAALQLWRVHWLAHWFAIVGFTLLLTKEWSKGDRVRALSLVLAALLVWGNFSLVWIPLLLSYLFWPSVFGRIAGRVRRVICGLFAIGIVVLFFSHASQIWFQFRVEQYQLDAFPMDWYLLSFPLLVFSSASAVWRLWTVSKINARWAILLMILFPLVGVSAIRWDARSPIARAIEANEYHRDVFGFELPADAQVFWHGEYVTPTWLVLQRADYFDESHLPGISFHRGTIVEARSRIRKLEPLLNALSTCDRRPLVELQHDCGVPSVALAATCASGDVSHPDYLILPYRLKMPEAGRWSPKHPTTGRVLANYWLYDCEVISATISAEVKAPDGLL
ncbi:MAG TPA: hypothetical protein VFN29_13515 [Chiayiivirga sp.]|nr:hypothetical protein [Chiayiivirga sp.]